MQLTWVVIFYTDTKSLEQELMKFLVQKEKFHMSGKKL